MTFSALSYLVWYKKHKQFVKDMVNTNNLSAAKTRLEALILEYSNNFETSSIARKSEFSHFQHSLEHLDAAIPTASIIQLEHVKRILDEDADH